MAGVDLVIALQGTELAKRAQFLFHIAAGEIRSAAAAAEEGVAGEESLAAAQAHPAGGVTGGGDDLKAQRADLDAVPVAVVFPVCREVEGEVGVMAFVPIVQTVEVYGGAGLLRDGVHGAHMVIVTVSQKNSPTAQVVFLQIVQNEIALVTGVDDGAVQGGFVGDHIAVGLQLAHG